MSDNRTDRRIDRTRQALLNAFRDELLATGWQHLTVRKIVERANVGRSTFYEHFETKDDILCQSIDHVFRPLTETIGPTHSARRLQMVLEHFWQGRNLTRAMMASPARHVLIEHLASLFEETLQAHADGAADVPLTLPMIAKYLAGQQLALLECWLESKSGCSAASVASALHKFTNALVNSMAPR